MLLLLMSRISNGSGVSVSVYALPGGNGALVVTEKEVSALSGLVPQGSVPAPVTTGSTVPGSLSLIVRSSPEKLRPAQYTGSENVMVRLVAPMPADADVTVGRIDSGAVAVAVCVCGVRAML